MPGFALYPGYDEAHYRLGVVLQALGRNKEAVKPLRAALDQARFKGQAEKVRELENRLSSLE